MPVEKKMLLLKYKLNLIEISYFMHLWNTKTILFLHWLWSSKDDFLGATQNKKTSKHTIIGFDFPWHGDSKYIENLDIDDLVQITHLVIEKLEIKNFILIGHSMWWLVGLLYVKKFNPWLKAFINVEWNLTENDCWFSWYITSLDYVSFKEKIWDNPAMFDLSPSMVEYSRKGDLLNLFISLAVPKVFIYGEESKIPYITELEDKGIQTIKIFHSWHHPFDTNPNKFYEIIWDF